jgi:hypothetical protein
MEMNSKSNIVISLVVILLVIGAAVFLLSKPRNEEGVVCTMEAKLCPDGSYVGRSGSKCEFAACPTSPETSGWKTTTDSASGVTFKYPESIPTTYLHPVDWPPQVQVISGPFVCSSAGDEKARAGKTESKLINGREYCVTTVAEGAAGSIYTEYAYARALGTKTLYFTFTIQRVQCGNFSEPEMGVCQTEQSTYNVDLLADGIIQTATLQ